MRPGWILTRRSAALAALAGAEHQVLVVGGGVVGAGVALDAATRGLSVGLVEARDFGSGTSSRSSKLIHGGLRYLEQLNLGLVREALAERSLLLRGSRRTWSSPVPFLFPLTHHVWERAYVGAGVSAYDVLGFSLGQTRGLPGHHQLSRRAALQGRARAQALGHHRRHRLLGRAGRRRPLRDHPDPHRGRVRRAGGVPDPGTGPAARGGAGHRGARGGPGVRRRDRRSGPSRWSTRPACGPTRSRRWSAAAG